MTAFMALKGKILVPDQSLEFTGSNYLSMSDSNFGSYSLTTLAISIWVQPSNNPVVIIGHATGSAADSAFDLTLTNVSGTLRYTAATYHGSSSNSFVSTTGASGWDHLLIHFDPTNGTSGNRIKMWLNGSAETAFTSSLTNSTSMNNATTDVRIGSSYFGYTGDIYQPGIFSGSLPAIGDVYNNGPKDIRGVSGLYSLIQTDNGNITDDYVISTNWTNNGGVALSTDVPS